MAEYLLEHAQSVYGVKLALLVGESAGANLAAATAFHILRTQPSTANQLTRLCFFFGHFDNTLGLPYMNTFQRNMVINRERMERFRDAYLPNHNPSEWRSPLASPIYEDMQSIVEKLPEKKLPSALFVCGDQDPLLDDTILMSTKWMSTGSQACVKIFAGMPHGFTMFPNDAAKEANAIVDQFLADGVKSLSSSSERPKLNTNKRRHSYEAKSKD